MCTHTCPYNLRGQKQVLDLMGLVQAIGSRNQSLVLCRRVLRALNSWVISPVPQLPCFFVEFSPEKTYVGASCLSEWAGEGRGVLLQYCPLSFSSPTNATQRWPLQSLSIEATCCLPEIPIQHMLCIFLYWIYSDNPTYRQPLNTKSFEEAGGKKGGSLCLC